MVIKAAECAVGCVFEPLLLDSGPEPNTNAATRVSLAEVEAMSQCLTKSGFNVDMLTQLFYPQHGDPYGDFGLRHYTKAAFAREVQTTQSVSSLNNMCSYQANTEYQVQHATPHSS